MGKRFHIFYASFVFLCGTVFASAESVGEDKQYNSSDGNTLQLENAALRGDVEASVRLVRYFTEEKDDYQSTRFWLQVAAENGDQMSERNLGAIYMSELPKRGTRVTSLDERRACFWIEKAKKDGLSAVNIGNFLLRRCSVVR